jgi:hypothetical protein
MKYILIILFATVFSYLIAYSFQLVLQSYYEISSDDISFAFWGDTYFFRILASILATAIGGFIIGSFLKQNSKTISIIFSIPIVAFWGFVLVNYYQDSIYVFSFFSRFHMIPFILTLLSLPIAYYGNVVGVEFQDEFMGRNCILNIKWYHWIWIFPFLLNQVVSVLVFLLFLLWKSPIEQSIMINFIYNFGNIIAYFVIMAIFVGFLRGVKYLYNLLTDHESEIKFKWLKICGIVIVFNIIYLTLIGSRLINL